MFQQQCGFCSEDGAESINIAPSSEFTVAGAELGSDRTKGHHFRITATAKCLTLTQSGVMFPSSHLYLTGADGASSDAFVGGTGPFEPRRHSYC